MPFASYNEAVGEGGHSVPSSLKMRLRLQETSGSVAHNSAISVNETIVGYTPTADVGPTDWLPNALVAGAAPNTVTLASMIALGNRTLIGWAYLPAIANPNAAGIISGQYGNGNAGITFQRKLTAKRGTTVTSTTSLVTLGEWVQLCYRHDGSEWQLSINGTDEVIAAVQSGSTNILGLETNDLGGEALRLANWSVYDAVLTDEEVAIYFRGNEPIRSAHPAMSQDDSTWWASTGTYGLPSPLADDANGAFTYEWELRLSADDSVVQSGTGTPGGAKPAAGTYYVWLRVSNNAGYDADHDGESTDTALTAPEISSAEVNSGGDTLTISGSDTLANSSGFTITADTAVTATYSSGSGTSSLVYSLSRTIDKDEALILNYSSGDVTIGGSPLGEFTGYTVTNSSTQDLAGPIVQSATVASGSLTIVADENLNNYTGFTLSSDTGHALPLTYSSGDGTDTLVFSVGRDVGSFETLTLDYTPGNVQDDVANAMESLNDFAVTNDSAASSIWLPTVLDICGELLILQALDETGTIDLNTSTGATGDLTVNLGSGSFTISPDHVGIQSTTNRILVIIPESERVSSPSGVTVSAAEGWVTTQAGADVLALSQTLTAENTLKETIPSVTPRQQQKFGANFGKIGYYQSALAWSNLARLFDGGWQHVSDNSIASLTSLGLPADAVTTDINALSAGGIIPADSFYIMWEGDTSIEFSITTGPTTEDSDTTSGDKRWKKYSWPSERGDSLWITCSGDCSSITNFVVCRDTDWDDTAKDVATEFVPEMLDRFKGITHMRFLERQSINKFSAPDEDHITNEEYITALGILNDETAAISNIEDYTANSAYYTTDGDYFGTAGSHPADGSSILKVTHDGSVAFRTGDYVTMEDVVGAIDGASFNNDYRLTSQAIYVPTGATTYFYIYAKELDTRIEFTYTSGGNVTAARRYGASPELLAGICNYLHANGSLTHIWVMCGHHESTARQAAYAARLNAALTSTIKVCCELSNEWTFNFFSPFSVAYYHFRRIFNVAGVDGMDDVWDAGAYYLSQFYDTLVAEFGESRVEPIIAGQTYSAMAFEGMLDSSLLTAPVQTIAGTNYFGSNFIEALGFGLEEVDSLTPSAICTLASEAIHSLAVGNWASLSALATARSLDVINYEGGTHTITYNSYPIEYTSGWTNASGNRYTQSEFRYITAMKNGSTTLTKAVDATACESTNNSFFWDSSGEVLHVNLSGTDPDTVTLTAMRYDRLSMAERYHTDHPRFARVINRMFDTCDTLGIAANQYTMLGRQGNDGSNEAFNWGTYSYFDMVAGDGIGTPDHETLVEQVYRGDILKGEYYPQIESIRGYEINRWTDPENFLPVATLVVIDSAGTEVTVTFSKAVESGADGWSGLVVGGEACTYSSGTGTDTIVFTCSAISSGTQTAAYTQPGDGIQDADGGLLATFSGMATTNNVPGVTTPTVTTDTASSIATTTATSGGNVTADGGATVTARGVCWSTSASPTTGDSTTSDGSGTGTFTSSLTGLTANTLYYVRAYATNSEGTAYGDQETFSTLAITAPTVTTSAASSVTSSGATVGGNVTGDGNATVTSRGVYWSLTSGPTVSDNVETAGAGGTGSYTVSISGVDPETTVYVKAWATNSAGTATGSEVNFTTSAESGEAMSYNQLMGYGSHSLDSRLKAHCPLQETSGTSAAERATEVAATITGHTPTAGGGPTTYLPNALVGSGSSGHIVRLATPVSLGNRTYLAHVYQASGVHANAFSGTSNAGGCRVSSTGQIYFNRGGTARTTTMTATANTWQKVAVRTDGTSYIYNFGATKETIAQAESSTDSLLGFANLAEGSLSLASGCKLANPAAFNAVLTDAEVAEYFAGPEPLNSTAGSIQVQGGGDPEIGSTLEVNTAATYDSQSNGTATVTYRWFVNDVYQSTGATFDTTGLSVDDVVKFQSRGTNDGGYDAAEDTDSSNSITMVAASGGDGDDDGGLVQTLARPIAGPVGGTL